MFFYTDQTSSASDNSRNKQFTDGGFRRSKTDLHLAFRNYNAREPPAKSCWGRPRAESQIKMRLYQWASKKPMETSKGVQQIIDQVSVMMGKNDAAKDISGSFTGGTSKAFSPKIDYSTAEELKRASTSVESEIDIAKSLIRFLEKTETAQNRCPVRRSESVSGNSQWFLTPKVEPEAKLPPKKNTEVKEAEPGSNNNPITRPTGESVSRKPLSPGRSDRLFEVTKRNSKAGLASRLKPSEIPLRRPTPPKSPTRKPKVVSLLTQKPSEEVETAGTVDVAQRKKCNTTIREQGLEIGDEKPRATSEVKEVSEEGRYKGEVSNNIRLNRCIKSSNIPVDSESANEKPVPESDKKMKKVNLVNAKSSSLTILRKSNTLSRLESLHQQNLSAKVNGLNSQDSASKLKMVGAKTSFSGLRKKGSKKNLSDRSSSKGNKPSLNMRGKVKKEKGGKAEKSTNENHEVSKQKTFRNTGSRTYRKDNPTNEGNLERVPKPYKKPNTVEGLVRSKEPKTPVDAKRKDCDFPKPEILKSPSSDPAIVFEKELNDTGLSTLGEIVKEVGDSLKEEDGNETKKMTLSNDLPLKDHKLVENPTEGSWIPSKSFIITSSSKQKLEKPASFAKKTQEKTKPDNDGKPNGNKPKSNKLKDDKLGLKKMTALPLKVKTIKLQDLVVKGTALRFLNEKPPLKPKDEVKTDVSHEKKLEAPEAGAKCSSDKASLSFDWVFMNPEKCNEEQHVLKESSNDSDSIEEEKGESLLATDVKPRGSEAADNGLKKNCGSSSSLKRKLTCRTSAVNIKSMTKKLRSDAGDRRMASSFFNTGLSFQNKGKPDAKLRSGLTKSYREGKVASEKKDIFEDSSAMKLRERNSEPHSFRGFVWKRADFTTPRGNKNSASSMASSLRHLNTDDLEDFIFWEVVPQKVTQCWEKSLYLKRPWSVLSYSVFKDNRQSNTPGLILANLRNGGSSTASKSPATRGNDRPSCPQRNAFDVEPSIAQKNIDIRNWLAALNFPTIPSTSNDVISEGCCSQSSMVAINVSKNQVSPKRRNVLTDLKFPDEVMESKPVDTEKSNESSKWSRERLEPDLMDLIRKSETSDSRGDISNPEIPVESKASCTALKKPETPEKRERDNAVGGAQAAPGQTDPWDVLGQIFTGHLNPFPSDFNVWKYLFLITLCFFTFYYSLLSGDRHLP